MKAKHVLFAAGLVASASAMAAPQLQTEGRYQEVVPTHIAPIYVIDGETVYGDFVPYVATGNSLAGERISFDQYQGDIDTNNDVNPIGGELAPCSLAGPGNRYFFGTGFNMPHTVNDFANMEAGSVGQRPNSVTIAWNHNPVAAEPMLIDVRWWNEHNADCSGFTPGTDSVIGARNFLSGVALTFGGGAPQPPGTAGYFISRVDLSTLTLATFPDRDGAYEIRLLTARTPAVTFATRSQPMLWGTQRDFWPGGVRGNGPFPSRPGGPGNDVEWQERTSADNTFIVPTDCFNMLTASGTLCIRPLSSMIAWFRQDFTPPLPFALISPANGTQSSNLNPTFEWEATTPLPQSYTVKISLSADLSNPTLTASNIVNVNTFTVPPENTLSPCTQYYWGVEAVNGALITQSTPVSHSYFTSSVDLSADFNLDGQVDF
ncbi:MAG: hypothetical protein SFZ23_14345, partial [Planctomycetota bacterium]|nr:hypothetical protein [Planctomycetota bacterium]